MAVYKHPHALESGTKKGQPEEAKETVNVSQSQEGENASMSRIKLGTAQAPGNQELGVDKAAMHGSGGTEDTVGDGEKTDEPQFPPGFGPFPRFTP